MKTWKDYPRKSDTVALVGFAETTRGLAPFDNEDVEIWALNEEYNFDWLKRYDRWFQMHPRWDFKRENNANDPNHFMWLQNVSGRCNLCKGTGRIMINNQAEEKCTYCDNGVFTPDPGREGTPIYMQRAHEDIPWSVEYPLQEAIDYVGHEYFISSPAFMLVLAYLMGFKRVELYGFEMGSKTEYHYQRANFEYLIAIGRAKGVEIYIPEKSSLCTGKTYGYKNMSVGFRQQLEMRKSFLEGQQMDVSKTNVNTHVGRIKMLQELMEKYPGAREALQKDLEEQREKYDFHIGQLNVVKGALAEVNNLTDLFDGYYFAGTEGGDNA